MPFTTSSLSLLFSFVALAIPVHTSPSSYDLDLGLVTNEARADADARRPHSTSQDLYQPGGSSNRVLEGRSPFPHTDAWGSPAQLRHVSAINARASSDLLSSLFPLGNSISLAHGFTTASDPGLPANVAKVELSDKSLGVFKVASGMTHNVVQEDGKSAWEAVYPKGSWTPGNTPRGGFGFYVNGTDDFHKALMAGASDVLFGYSVMFEDGFEWNMGGKVPGAYGGDGAASYGCTGGRQSARSQCFDARLMWRTSGQGELYTYLPLTDANHAAQLAVPGTVDHSTDGISVGRGAYRFAAGKWVTVAERVKPNSIAKDGKTGQDGEIQLYVNGKLVIDLQKVQLRSDMEGRVMGLHFQTFFGGGTKEWASPKTQKAWFADGSGAIVKA